jgi:hypothetical protein
MALLGPMRGTRTLGTPTPTQLRLRARSREGPPRTVAALERRERRERREAAVSACLSRLLSCTCPSGSNQTHLHSAPLRCTLRFQSEYRAPVARPKCYCFGGGLTSCSGIADTEVLYRSDLWASSSPDLQWRWSALCATGGSTRVGRAVHCLPQLGRVAHVDQAVCDGVEDTSNFHGFEGEVLALRHNVLPRL